MNNTLEGTNSRITEAEEQISDLKDKNDVNYCCKAEYRKNNEKKKEYSLRNIGDKVKHTNICIIGFPEGEGREKGPKKIFREIITENVPNMGKEIVNQVQEVQRVPGKINPRRNIPKHIIIKLTKI